MITTRLARECTCSVHDFSSINTMLIQKFVNVNNTMFKMTIAASWRSGLGFNALIHSHRPDLIDFNKLTPGKHIENLNYAFDVAQNELGVPRLLDAEGKLQC